MLPYKENIDLSEFPVKFFTASSDQYKTIAAHPHWHNAIELLYVTSGTASQQIGERIIKIEKGDIVLIWSNQFHSTYSINDGHCEISVLQINTNVFITPASDSKTSDKVREISFYDKIKSTSELGSKLLNMINQIIPELACKKEGYDFMICGIIHCFIGEIIRNQSLLPVHHVKKYSENDKITALRVFKYIEDNYNEEIPLHKIASEVNLSKTHFLRVFKNVSGMTFKQYLNYFRVNKSVLRLENGEGVTEAAMKSGFSDINTFIRNFKKYKGTTPSKYKR